MHGVAIENDNHAEQKLYQTNSFSSIFRIPSTLSKTTSNIFIPNATKARLQDRQTLVIHARWDEKKREETLIILPSCHPLLWVRTFRKCPVCTVSARWKLKRFFFRFGKQRQGRETEGERDTRLVNAVTTEHPVFTSREWCNRGYNTPLNTVAEVFPPTYVQYISFNPITSLGERPEN